MKPLRSFNFSGKQWTALFMFVFFLIFSLIVWNSYQDNPTKVFAKSGVIHLNANSLKKAAVPLDGEWKFVWQQLKSPEALAKEESSVMTLPRMWNGFKYEKMKLPAHGYGTYQLKVIVDDGFKNENLALYIPFVHSSYTLYINNEVAGQLGKSDTTSKSYIPAAKTFIIPIRRHGDTILLTLQVANFAYSMGGVWESLRIGTDSSIQSHYDRQLAFDLFTFGCLFIMSLYHIALYFMRKKVRSNLFFGLMCFFASIKNLFSGVVFFYIMVPEASYELGLKLIHISMFASSLLLWLFLRELFTQEFPRVVGKLLGIITAICILITIFTGSHIYSQIMLPFWVISAVLILLIFRGIYFALRHKREGASIILAGIICFLLAVVHDIAIDLQIVQNIYLFGAGYFLFIFSQALLLAVKFTNSFQAVENITEDLMNTNKSLSRFVPGEFLSYLNKGSITECNLSDNLQGEMTVFFSDIRSYTSLSEKMSPGTNFAFINDYLGRVVYLIDENQGVVNQYLGDGILALFLHTPLDAVRAAIRIQQTVSGVKELGGFKLEQKLETGIGIHSGEVILGMLGTEQRMSAAVISDTVNTASRLEGLTKYFGAQIIISEPALLMIADTSEFEFRFLGKIQVKGKQSALKIFEITDGLPVEDRNAKAETRIDFEEGLKCYFNRHFKEAMDSFFNVLASNPKDLAAQVYYRNSEVNLKEGVPEEWEGTLRMEIK